MSDSAQINLAAVLSVIPALVAAWLSTPEVAVLYFYLLFIIMLVVIRPEE